MAPPVGSPDGTVRSHEVLLQHGPAYLERFGVSLPSRL